jgi:hypothetical protein
LFFLCAFIGSALTQVIAPRLVRVLAALEALAAKDLTAFVKQPARTRSAALPKPLTPAWNRCAAFCSP